VTQARKTDSPEAAGTATSTTATIVRCTFCGKPSTEVTKVIAGPGVYICNECVQLCNEILLAELTRPRLEPGAWEQAMTDEQILELLPKVAATASQTEASLRRLVLVLRSRGITWARIGSALQITRQSAWERFSGEE
jgi:hypothetical protein